MCSYNSHGLCEIRERSRPQLEQRSCLLKSSGDGLLRTLGDDSQDNFGLKQQQLQVLQGPQGPGRRV